ncbi:hypothetical protein BGZ95_003465 [Linnemannia exigua]|uniref:Uncharacterized protein n=1 Tax=Linnemannia exigua TaxID=604196 RepID=A0AAD4D4N4_9FUNG|nr:hypothetical protein BGZ95_003465 [Linnemannia exigua]
MRLTFLALSVVAIASYTNVQGLPAIFKRAIDPTKAAFVAGCFFKLATLGTEFDDFCKAAAALNEPPGDNQFTVVTTGKDATVLDGLVANGGTWTLVGSPTSNKSPYVHKGLAALKFTVTFIIYHFHL